MVLLIYFTLLFKNKELSPAYSIVSTLHKAMVTSSKLDFCWMLEANKLGPLRHQPQLAVAWNIKASDNSCR